MTPKVFISHSSADKERFVRDFATKLRASGIDAWFDEWEIKPGDSLARKLFTDGIGNADAFVVVVSANSVTSRWVQEELDAAVVRRITEDARLIPIIIDDCAIPDSLKHLVWKRIGDITSYDRDFGSIVDTIYGHSDKPVLGQPPPYVTTPIEQIPGLKKVDSLVIKIAAEAAIVTGASFVDPEYILALMHALGYSQTEIMESLDVLYHRGYIKLIHVLGGQIAGANLTENGLDAYVAVYYPEYDSVVTRVATALVNFGAGNSQLLATHLSVPTLIVTHVINRLLAQGLITAFPTIGSIEVTNISAELKRRLSH